MTQINHHILANHNDLLMEKVVEPANIKKALERVERNKGSAGVDNMQVEELRPYLNKHWKRIKQELLDGTYQPSPCTSFRNLETRRWSTRTRNSNSA